MNENVEVIVNGGSPIDDCPKNWEDAKAIIEKMNENRTESDLVWSFDCGFKLDLDGEVVSISSRFYPPKGHYGKNWDGHVSIYLFGKEIKRTSFCCNTLEELKKKVEDYVGGLRELLLNTLLYKM